MARWTALLAVVVAVPHALTQEYLAWAMRKEDRPTVDRINAALQD